MLSRLHLGQKSGRSRNTVRSNSRSRVFAPQMGHRSHFSSVMFMLLAPPGSIAMDHAEKEADVRAELFQTFTLPFRLPITDADERQHRRNVSGSSACISPAAINARKMPA